MSILTVIQQAAPKCGFATPSQLIADTGQTSLEIQATLQTVAEEIASRYDWQAYKTLGTLTGDGVLLAFPFPANYSRMLKATRLWPSAQPNAPLTHITDTDVWLGMVTQAFTAVVGAWTIFGDQINIRMGGQSTPLALAATVSFYFITNLLWKDSGGTPKTAINTDSDVFRLPERLLKLGFIAQWKSDKGRPYAQDRSDFEDALATAIGNDKGPKIISVGRRRFPAELALPWGVVDNGGP